MQGNKFFILKRGWEGRNGSEEPFTSGTEVGEAGGLLDGSLYEGVEGRNCKHPVFASL